MTRTSPRSLSDRLTLTNVLIAINAIAYLWEAFAGGPHLLNNLISGPEYLSGALYGPDVASGAWWLVVTAAFLHGSLLHVGVNMLALHMLGRDVETLYGHVRFAAIYAFAVAGSGLAVLSFNYDIHTLGASGAIYGLFGAIVALGLRLGKRGRGLIGRVLPVIVINLVITFTVPGISMAAHVGGLVSGILAGYIIFAFRSPQRDLAYALVLGPEIAAAADVPEEAADAIEAPGHAGPHEEAGEPVLRDPRE